MAANPPTPTRHRRVTTTDPGRGHGTLDRQYARAVSRWSDVQDHLPTFLDAVLSRNAKVVVELGSRGGVSTVAWLYGVEQTGGHLWTVDLAPAPPRGHHIFWEHIQGDDLSDEVLRRLPSLAYDVLFIDTSHDYAHTLAELEVYVPRVQKGGVVLLHDTLLEHPDGIEPQDPFPVRRALDYFCEVYDRSWFEYPGSFGLGQIDV